MSAADALDVPTSPSKRMSIDGRGYPELDGKFTLHETVGQGTFAKVKRAEHNLTKDFCALKVVDKTRLSEKEMAMVMSEVEAMSELESKHIVRLYMVVETDARLCLALEYAEGGDLYDHIVSMGKLSEVRTRLIFTQIVRALDYCHTLGYAHRDLKAENVVFTDAYASIIKLTDFGFCVKDASDRMLETMCGSMMYSAPEILLAEPYNGQAADIWSLGVVFYLMITGGLPFDDSSESTAVTKVMDVNYQKPEAATAECHGLIAKLLVKDPKGRLPLADVLQHPFMTRESLDGDQGLLEQPVQSPVSKQAQPKKGSLLKPLALTDPLKTKLSPLKKKATLVPRRPSKIKTSAKRKVMNFMVTQGFQAAEVEASINEHKRDYNSCTFFLLLEQEARNLRKSGRTAGSFRKVGAKAPPAASIVVEEPEGGGAPAVAAAAAPSEAVQPAVTPVDGNGEVAGSTAAATPPTTAATGESVVPGERGIKPGESMKERKTRLKKQRASMKQEAKLAKKVEKQQAKDAKAAEKAELKRRKTEAKRQKKAAKKKGDDATATPAGKEPSTLE
mmetsp:Transcript_10374/g.26590  ORF Transcript_10374/g.26590 Transcript_10374/m.26590 type:complete len:561 (+) Transcript_10374:115-1797(+)